MLSTIVQRAPADKRGDDISDILLTTLEAQVARGRAEINRNCSNRRRLSCTVVPLGFIAPGSTVQVADMEQGALHGVVDSYSLSMAISGNDLQMSASMTYETEEPRP